MAANPIKEEKHASSLWRRLKEGQRLTFESRKQLAGFTVRRETVRCLFSVFLFPPHIHYLFIRLLPCTNTHNQLEPKISSEKAASARDKQQLEAGSTDRRLRTGSNKTYIFFLCPSVICECWTVLPASCCLPAWFRFTRCLSNCLSHCEDVSLELVSVK